MQELRALTGTDAQGPILGSNSRPFLAVLVDDDRKRAAALSALLSSLATPDVRVIRMGSLSRSHQVLERVLAPATGSDNPARLADNARLIARAIAERQGQETRVVLLIRQAERLRPGVLRSLQAMAPYFAQAGEPTLQVAFIGRPEFRGLLDTEDLTPLRKALGIGLEQPGRPFPTIPPQVVAPQKADAAWRPEPAVPPRTAPQRGRVLVRGLQVAMVLAAMTGAAYFGLHKLFYRDEPARPVVVAAAPAAPLLDAPPTEAQRSALPEPLMDRPPKSASPPVAPEPHRDQGPSLRSDPRIVIHVPAGSAAAEALSARLLKTLAARPGTVEARRVADTPTRPSIRYFHPEDEPAARQAAAWMADTGLNWALRDFSTFQPRPSRGTIEVWLPRAP